MDKIDTSAEAVTKLLDGVTPGPWGVGGEVWNQIVWSAAENRVCFMAHSNGLDDERDIATARFIAAARTLVPALLADRDDLRAKLEDALEALEYVLDGYGLNPPDFKRQPEDDEDDWIVERLRATIAKIKGADHE